jgi:hypothetical protein
LGNIHKTLIGISRYGSHEEMREILGANPDGITISETISEAPFARPEKTGGIGVMDKGSEKALPAVGRFNRAIGLASPSRPRILLRIVCGDGG